MPTIYGIISRGYFPKELPPAFTSEICGSVLANNLSRLPNDLINRDRESKNTIHHLLVRGSQRRRLGIPNPTNFFRLSSFIVANWKFLTTITSQSHISMTTPVGARPPNRAISSKSTFSDYDDRRAYIRSKSRYIFKADISRLYHSIYTHSISWAIHGKSVAKAKRHDKTLKGNILDRLIRNTQDGQSVGIPIGPDTSLLIAEIILSAIDVILATKGINNAFRIIDDYEFGCASLIEAESLRDILQEGLSEYELTLNPSKMDVIELPIPIEAPYISQLRTYQFSINNPVTQRHEIIHYFGQAFAFSREYPEKSVLKYAVSRLSGIKVSPANWTLCENLLMQCATVDPSTIEVVLNQLVRYRDLRYTLELPHIGEALNRVISRHAPPNHGSEVAWAIWALMVLSVPIDDDATRAASMNDSIVAILMLDAKAKGLISSSVNFNHFQSYMTTDDLYGGQWLLAYEANIKNWLPSVTGRDHVNRDKCFSFLKTNGVYFYDDTLSGKVKFKRPEPLTPGEEY